MYLLPHYIDLKKYKNKAEMYNACIIAQKHVCLPKLLQSKWFTDTDACGHVTWSQKSTLVYTLSPGLMHKSIITDVQMY